MRFRLSIAILAVSTAVGCHQIESHNIPTDAVQANIQVKSYESGTDSVRASLQLVHSLCTANLFRLLR